MKTSLRSKLLPQSQTLYKQIIIIARQDKTRKFFSTQLHLHVIQIGKENSSDKLIQED